MYARKVQTIDVAHTVCMSYAPSAAKLLKATRIATGSQRRVWVSDNFSLCVGIRWQRQSLTWMKEEGDAKDIRYQTVNAEPAPNTT